MQTWILLVALNISSGTAAQQLEFTSEQDCKRVAELIHEKFKSMWSSSIEICFVKTLRE